MRISMMFSVMVIAVLMVGCVQQTREESGPIKDKVYAAQAPKGTIEADINWERLDLGAIDFSADLESLDADLDFIEDTAE